MSVVTPERRQSGAKKNAVSMLVSRKAHQDQLPATPWARVSPVTRFGVSVENVVATSEVPRSHQGIERPERKNSSALSPDFRPARTPMETEVASDPATIPQSRRLSFNVRRSLLSK